MEIPEHFNGKTQLENSIFLPMDYTHGKTVGYNIALEKTNAKELYELLIQSKDLIKFWLKADGGDWDAYEKHSPFMNKLNEAIEKAKNPK